MTRKLNRFIELHSVFTFLVVVVLLGLLMFGLPLALGANR